MANNYMNDTESMADLVSRMQRQERDRFEAFRHMRVEGAFVDRVFVIYQPTGLTPDRRHRPPRILGQIRVKDFRCDARHGCCVTVEDSLTGATQHVDYIPALCFSYDFFIGLPPFSRLRWDARFDLGGSVERALTFGLLFKTRSRAEFYSKDCVMAETPNSFRRLYPDVPLSLLTL